MATSQKLIFQNSEAVKNAIMDSQKKEIAELYEKWADEIGKKAEQYSKKTTPSSVVAERQMKELQKQLKATSHEVSNEIHSKIKKNMYTIADAVVADNVKWLESFGFSADGLNAAFSYVPDEIVRNLVTGQIYQGGWNLSSKIWGDNEATLKSTYQIVAKGLAENKPIYDIAKELEQYVSPSKQKNWNPVLAMKNTKTGKIEYKRIYKKQVDYNAQRLARTLVQHSYQQSFIAVTKDNPFIEDYIWHSNGSRVCPLCLARDKKHFKKDELPMDHPNGMCTMEPAVAKDMVDQLANWFNNPDGTYPEIDKFASNFGYEVKQIGTPLDFVNKYGMSTKSPNAWFNGLTQIQKAEAKALKDKSGMTWNKWYETYIQSTGDPTQDFIKKYGTSTKSPNAWYNSISAAQKAEAKLLKEKSGLNWTQWYEQNIFAGGGKTTVKKTVEAKVETKVKVKAFNEAQEKYLKPYGYSVDNMPINFSEWSHKISHDEATEILVKMGSSWSDKHPYQVIEKYFKQNLTSSKFIEVDASDVAKVVTKKKTIKELGAVSKDNLDDYIELANSGNSKAYTELHKLFKKHGLDLDNYVYSDGPTDFFDLDDYYFKKAKKKVIEGESKVTTTTTTKEVITKESFKTKYSKEQFKDIVSDAYYNDSKEAIKVIEEFLDLQGLPKSNYMNLYGQYTPNKLKNVMDDFYSNASTPKPKTNVSSSTGTFDSNKWLDSLKKNDLSVIERDWTNNWLSTLTKKEKDAVTTYTGSAYSDMNRYLRGQQSSTRFAKEIEECKKALEKASLPEETIVRRGAGTSVLKNLGIGDITPENRDKFIGAIIHDKGFMSTSPDASGGFSGVEYVIKLPAGSQAMYVAPISKFKYEKELLINCGGKFVIEELEFDKFNPSEIKRVYMTLMNLQN